MDINLNTDNLQICRTCMKTIIDSTSFFYLDCTPLANTQLTIKQMLYCCIAELDLSFVPNAVMCSKCVDNLFSVFKFKKNCLGSEIQINKYIQQVQHTGDLNLAEVVQLHQPDIKNLDIEVKIEDFEFTEDFKNGDLVCDTSAFNEASECIDSTELKYLLKLENVDMEDALNYDLSEAEANSDTQYNSSIGQNCLPEEFERKNLNKSNAYYQCYRCGHKAESKLKLILHLKHHTRKNYHKEIISRSLSRDHKNLIYYYRCSLCNYLTKYECLFDFHMRIHLIKKKHIIKLKNVHTKAICTTIKVNKTNYVKGNKRKLLKNCNNYYKNSFKNQSKSKKSKQHLSHCNIKPNMRAHLVEKLFKCSICEYQCNFKGNLKRHLLIHTEAQKPFSCSVCEYQCSQKSYLKRHILIHTYTGDKPFLCSVCESQFSHKSSLKTHMRIHTGKKPFSCSICEYQCYQNGSLKRHMLTHAGEKPFSCSVCEYRCSQISDLQKHILIHTGEKPFSCSICEYQCNRKGHLKTHMLTHTGEKPFSCFVCKYQTSVKSNLKTHMLIHTREKPFSCSVCDYHCSQKQHLKGHMLIHTAEKPFACSICEYKCNRKCYLKTHMLTHTGEKPFSCFVCKYQSSLKSNLKTHMLIHTKEKPFSCSVCEYRCRQKQHLKEHMLIHTGEKPFSCFVCKYRSRLKSNLKTHMLIHTRENH